jgi:hypothetical protein
VILGFYDAFQQEKWLFISFYSAVSHIAIRHQIVNKTARFQGVRRR